LKKIGLYFGTFNPIHIGHIIVAHHFLNFSDLEELWLVITPESPFKKKKNLLENHHRLEMVYRATENYPKIKPCDIEFKMPVPNYTINTLTALKEKYPSKDFSLIMGEDNLRSFHKWKNYEAILEYYSILVYPRIQTNKTLNEPLISIKQHPNIKLITAPKVEISSTFIRNCISEGKSTTPLLDKKVWEYIDQMNFYRK